MLKKLLTLFILFFIISSNLVLAVDSSSLNISSPSAILIDAKTGKILYEKNAYERMYPASTTKIMTAILTLENCDLSDTAIASYNAVTSIPIGYNTVNLEIGEELTIEQLLHLLLIPSANVAANILAEHIAGSVESFATMMNTKAVSIGCKDTNFTNPYGLHDENHYTTAYDLALMGQYAMKNDIFRSIVKKTSYILPPTNKYSENDRVFNTTNDLIRPNSSTRADNYYYKNAIGIKTGYTSYAKNCLVSAASSDGLEFIAVILGAEQSPEGLSNRFLESKALLEFGYDNYTIRKLKEADSIVKQIDVKNATRDTKHLDLLIQEDIDVLTEKQNIDKIILPEITLNENIEAPIAKGDVLGSITYTVEDIPYTTNLIAGADVEKSSFLNYVITIIFILLILILINKFVNKKKRKKSFKVKTY